MRVAEALRERVSRSAKVSDILLHPAQYEWNIRPISTIGLLVWKDSIEITPRLYAPTPEFSGPIEVRPRVIDIYHLYQEGAQIPVSHRRFADKETIEETYVKATGRIKRDRTGQLYLNTWWKPVPVSTNLT